MSEISPQEFGELTQAVRDLSKQVEELSKKVDTLQQEHNALMNRGKGFLAGLILVLGGGITAAYEVFRGTNALGD